MQHPPTLFDVGQTVPEEERYKAMLQSSSERRDDTRNPVRSQVSFASLSVVWDPLVSFLEFKLCAPSSACEVRWVKPTLGRDSFFFLLNLGLRFFERICWPRISELGQVYYSSWAKRISRFIISAGPKNFQNQIQNQIKSHSNP